MSEQVRMRSFITLTTAFMTLVSWNPSARAETIEKSFEIYGFAQGDYIQDFRRVNPAWKDTLRPTRIPTSAGQFGGNGEASLSFKQSRFGVRGNLPVDEKNLKTEFEFDLFGVGVDEGQTTIRPRHVYGEWGHWLAGQTNSLFMDGDAFPNVIDYWGPAGMVFLRNPQIRWTAKGEGSSFAIAIERPGNDIDPGNIREIDPDLGANIQPHNEVPDLTGMVRLEDEWGHIQVSGILRYLGYETIGTPDNNPKDHKTGWGANVSTVFKLIKGDKLILAAVYGEGIASYMNDGGVDLAPEGQLGSLTGKAVPLLGVMAYYDHSWNDTWTSSFGYSQTRVDNTSFQAASAFKRGEYVSANLLYLPAKNLLAGGEFLWGSRTDKNSAYGTDVRAQISLKYSFSSKDF